MPIVWAEGLKKEYTIKTKAGPLRRKSVRREALRGVSFSLEAGELVGYIGPNGAGKSTTIKILSGILTPDGGKCRVLGRTPWKERARHVRHIGVVFGQRGQLWWDLPVADSFALLRDIYRLSEAEYRRTPSGADRRCSASRRALPNAGAPAFSLGQRMRCELAASLLHEPWSCFVPRRADHRPRRGHQAQPCAISILPPEPPAGHHRLSSPRTIWTMWKRSAAA